ncbi:zinc-ribbon domain-containing protein [Dictyobacter vulcani]|uniref:zinc-ribbon domain-containing protein n=1 Tax=Dictyobacter vulcani TaxID=2607529 RepID=UPI0012503953|nr:zinc ribbon domain-containing protein [Dictyobacter vulcani]
MVASILTLEGSITLAFISGMYLAVFLCGMIVFVLVFFMIQKNKQKWCSVCTQRLRSSDNFCNYCGTAVLPAIRLAPMQPQQARRSYAPPTSYKTPQTPPPFPGTLIAPVSTIISTNSYHVSIDKPDYNCPRCHTELYFSDTFCGNCGSRLVPAVQQIQYKKIPG